MDFDGYRRLTLQTDIQYGIQNSIEKNFGSK